MQWWHLAAAAAAVYVLGRSTCGCPPRRLNHPDFSEGEHSLVYVSALDIQQLRAADGLPPSGPTFFSFQPATGRVQRHI